MNFNQIITLSPQERETIEQRAERKKEYNRRYQMKLRQAAKMITLENRIEDNLNYVIGYIKRNHADEYDNYINPVSNDLPNEFSNWVMCSSSEYSTIEQAFNFSGLDKSMDFKTFEACFKTVYKENDRGVYIKV